MRVGIVSRLACIFTVFSKIQGKTMAKLFEVKMLRGYTTAIITSHESGHPGSTRG